MTEDKRALLIENTARNIDGATDNIKYRHAAHCLLADEEYGTRLGEALSLKLDRIKSLSRMTHEERMKATSLS